MMADLPYAIQSSLGPSGSHLGVDSEYIRAFHNNVALSMEDPIWIHGPGKENYPTDSDYLGSLPVLNTGAGGSCLGIDPSNCWSDRLSTQLTLFYAGTVNVFDNVTTDKVQRILSLAAGSSPPLQSMGTVSPSFHSLRKQHPSCLQQSSSFGLNVQAPYVLGFTVQDAKSKNAYDSPQVQLPEECYNHDLADFLEPCEIMVPKALPIARKASLARFLERRKERLMAAVSQREMNEIADSIKATPQLGSDNICASSSIRLSTLYSNFIPSPNMEEYWFTSYNTMEVSEGASAT